MFSYGKFVKHFLEAHKNNEHLRKTDGKGKDMKITFEKESLENAVNDAMCAVSEKNTYKTLECIRFKTSGSSYCSITSFDLNKGFITEIPCEVEEEGNYLINAAKLNRIIKFLPDRDVTLSVNEKNIATLSSGRAKFELHALDGESFPNMPELDGDRGFSVDSSLLRTMIGQVYFAIALTDQRPMLCGAYFTVTDGKLKIVSCDGNRLAVREAQCDIENRNKDSSSLNLSFIVPGKTLSQLIRLMGDDDDKTGVVLGRKHVIFKLSDKLFFSRLIDSEYIDYNRVIPKETKINVRLSRAEFISSLERASLVTEDKALGQVKSHVKFEFTDGVLKVSSESVSGSVYDEVKIEKSGEDLVIGFNCRNFLDALKSCDSDMINLGMSSPLMCVVITSADEKKEEENKTDYLYVVCPVRMN